MKKALIALLTMTTFGLGALASGTLQPRAPLPSVPDRDPFTVTKTMKCEIVLLKGPDRILVRDPKTGEQTPLILAKKAKVRAASKKDFNGRKKLTFADLAVGQEVKISWRPHTHEIVKLRVVKTSRNES